MTNQILPPSETAPQSPEIKSLNEEVRQICHIEGHYPTGWIQRTACPCCRMTNLVYAFEKLEIRHDRCTNCDFVCVNPYPPETIIKRLYEGAYYTAMREYYELPRVRKDGSGSAYSAPLEVLEAIVERGSGGHAEGRWLDVGGGLGVFADFAARRLPGWSVALNEMNPRSAELAGELFGLDVLPSEPAVLAAEGKKYDVISSIAVLEHVADPEAFLRSYASLLRPGGLLISVVPHFSPLNVHVSKAASSNVTPPFHLSLFGQENLRQLLALTGLFDTTSVEQAGGPAFSLIEHIDFSKYWDSLLPTAELQSPVPHMVMQYTKELSIMLNSLADTGKLLEEFFAREDGRSYLIAYASVR